MPTVPGYDDPRPIPLSAKWCISDGDPFLSVRNVDGTPILTLQLKEKQTVCIYNSDIRHPTLSELTTIWGCETNPGEYEDPDFRWLYELFNPPGNCYTEWLGGPGKKLRVPMSTCPKVPHDGPGTKNPGSSGCASGTASIE